MGAGIIAPIGQLFTGRIQCNCAGTLRFLSSVRAVLCVCHFLFRIGRSRFCLFRCCRRIAPAGKDQPRFRMADLVRKLGIAFSLLCLTAQRSHLRIEARHQIFEPSQIAFGLAQFAFRIAPPHVKPGNARRFLQHLPALGRFRCDDLSDFALAHKRRGMSAGRRIGKGQSDIFCPHIAAIDPVSAARAALDPAGNFQFFAIAGRALQDDLGKVALRSGGSACKDDVFHPARAHGFGRVFAHDPAQPL